MPRSAPSGQVHPTDRVIGDAPVLETLRTQIRHLAAFDTVGNPLVPTLLLQGETGTGKGLVAQVIHESGPRARGPFVDINCAAMPETLLEAELFGFEAGTFTDAKRAKPGLIESAVQGTLFLDEIDALPILLQGKLLNVLDDKRVRRLGSVQSQSLDVKIIAATQADLSVRVAAGGFRPDLYHRLAVLLLEIPPLRARGTDIVLLARHFLRQYAEAHGLLPKPLGQEAEAWLMQYGWPGNVRELRHLMERVTLLSPPGIVQASTLEQLCLPRPLRAVQAEIPETQVAAAPVDELARLHQALRQAGGNVAQAARLLGMSRGALRYWMRRYGITRPHWQAVLPLHAEDTPGTLLPSAPERAPVASLERTPLGSTWEQKPVAVLALDVAWPESSARDAPRLEPWTLVRRWCQTMTEKVAGFGGTIMPQALAPFLAIFGLPQTLEQMPQRAVQAALALRYQLLEDHAVTGKADGPAVRMAIHLGRVLVDVQASEAGARLLPLGETLSLPVRLLGQALPGDILLSSEVRRLVEGWFELQGRQTPMLESRAGEAGVYAVVGLGARRSPLEVYGKRPLSRFVGREQEVAALGAILAQGLQGAGQLVGLVGEPGVGKSRLCYELLQAQRSQGWRMLESSPVAYGQETPYLPVIDLLQAYFQCDAHTAWQTVSERLRDRLCQLDAGLVSLFPALAALLGVPVDDQAWQALEPAQRRQHTLEACKRLFLRASQEQPLLLVVENLHWIDPETQDFLNILVESLPPARIVLLVNYRPDYQHSWGSKTYYSQLRLDPLSPGSAEMLLHELLGDHPGMAPLIRLLVARTAGNPFFLEESVRTLVETGLLVGARGAYELQHDVPGLQMPTTVQAVLAARIDRLRPVEKQLLQTAAVIGTEVPWPLLHAIAALPEALLSDTLRQLQAAEFVYESHFMPESVYTFKHAFTHEVAYDSLAPELRRGFHARIVEEMERLDGEHLSDQVDRLAAHALRGELWEKALLYCRQAAARAIERAAWRAALASLDQVLVVLNHFPESPERSAQAIDCRLDMLRALSPLGAYERAVSLLGEAEALARAQHDHVRLGRLLVRKTFLLRMTADHAGALLAGQQALELALSLGDTSLQVAAAHRLAQAYRTNGDLGQAALLLRGNVAALEAGAADPGRYYGIASRAWLGLILGECGAFPEGLHYGEEALRLALAEGQESAPIVAHGCLGRVYITQGRVERASAILAHGLALCQAVDDKDWGRNIAASLGETYVLAGRLSEGLALLQEALRDDMHTGGGQGSYGYADHVVRLSEVYRLLGRHDEARQYAHQALELARQSHERGFEALAFRQLGRLYTEATPVAFAQAVSYYRQALALADSMVMRPLVAHCRLGLGKLYRVTGHADAARAELSTALTLYRDMEMTFWLPEAAEALSGLEGP